MEEPLAFEGDDGVDSSGLSRAHQRSEPRDSMFLHSTIRRTATDESWPLRVRNLSSGGLMGDCPGTFERGDNVELEVRGVGLLQARIAWTAPNRIGLAFERPINPMLARKPVSSTVQRNPAGAPTSVKRPRLRFL